MSTSGLAEHNISTLRQILNLLEQLSRQPGQLAVGIGAHLRHVLEHYDAFLDGLGSGRIDYDARPRDRDLERSIEQAHQRSIMLIARLGELQTASLPPRILVTVASASDAEPLESWSSPDRELQFLQSHAVHHFALIRLQLLADGQDPGLDFGKAPATLRHERASA